MWYKSLVYKGAQSGRTIGFPTTNLDPEILPSDLKKGVYACFVDYKDIIYVGALYFGPRLIVHETKTVLEIYILNFDKEIYGEEIKFDLKEFIREPIDLKSLDELKKQLKKDVECVQSIL